MIKYQYKTTKKCVKTSLIKRDLCVIAICVSMLVFFIMTQAVMAAITDFDFQSGTTISMKGPIYGRLFHDSLSPMADTIYVKMEMKGNSDYFLDWIEVDQVSTDITKVKGYTQEFGIAYQTWSVALDNMTPGTYLVWAKAYDSNGNLMGERLIDETLTISATMAEGFSTRGGFSIGKPHEIFAETIKRYIDWDIDEIVDADNVIEMKEAEKLASAVYRINYQQRFSGTQPIRVIFDGKGVDKDKYDVFLCRYDESEKEWIKLIEQSLFYDDGDIGTLIGYTDCFGIFAVVAIEKESIDIVTIETDIDDPATTEPKDSVVDINNTSRPDSNTNDTRAIDIAGHWAENNISRLMSMNVVTGYTDGTFRPDNTITRAEFTTVLVKALNLDPKKSEMVFDDTADHWAGGYISTAVGCGVAVGFDEFNFCPDNLITREEIATMVTRAKQLSATSTRDFTDTPNISAWAQDAVYAAASSGIVGGYPDNSFKPQNDATKAEAVTIIVRLLDTP